jgi:hypothetical protein
LGVWGFTPSHFPTLPGVPDVTPGLPFGPHPCNPFALVASPKLELRHKERGQLVQVECKWCNEFSRDNLKHNFYIAHNLWEEAPFPSL